MVVTKKKHARSPHRHLPKSPTGIQGLDQVLEGGVPKGRPTLICGGPGCGKTLFGMEFLIKGATEFHEPGVFMAFEETEQDLVQNVFSLGFDLHKLVAQKKIALDYVRVERSEIAETGEYDLEGLFIRLDHAIRSIGAKRVVLDTVEALFAGLSNQAILRAELRRLFAWLKDKGVTAIITGERSESYLTRYGLEEYVADCVILLDHRVINQISTRRLRVIKYRGSFHGTNEYPFLIGEHGLSVLPITSLGLNHPAPTARVSTGIPQLDAMLGGKGYFRGSTVLVSGTAGSGKTSLAAAFVQAACRRGETCLYFAFEESPEQVVRNLRSININLEPFVRRGLLHFHAVRPTLYGLEMHLVTFHDMVSKLKPSIVVIDPLTDLIAIGESLEVKSMLTRLIDLLKTREITALLTSLRSMGSDTDQTEVGISSLIDAWILLRNIEQSGENNRALFILKSRGMSHSNQVREFRLSDRGVDLIDVCIEDEKVLTGSARLARETRERAVALANRERAARLKRSIQHKRQSTEAQIAALRATLHQDLEQLEQLAAEASGLAAESLRENREIAARRMDGQVPPL